MSTPKPPLYELEFSADAPFWTQGDASTRRAYLMPVTAPSEFLAFGVLGDSNEALFAARGQVREHLPAFISRMVADEARVELHVRPPLPGWLLKEFGHGPPFEGHEYEPPPPPPDSGRLATSMPSYESLRGSPLWTEGDASTRRALLMPVEDPSEFVAFGVFGSTEEVLFALRGTVREHLGEFISQMVREQSQVEIYARVPLPERLLRQYFSNIPAQNPGR